MLSFSFYQKLNFLFLSPNLMKTQETLDSMVCTEFWYSEVGRRAEGKNEISRESRRWWLPSPKVPKPGLSSLVRKNLLEKGNVVYQSFKAAKSINEQVLLEMPVPTIIKDSLPKVKKKSLVMLLCNDLICILFSTVWKDKPWG